MTLTVRVCPTIWVSAVVTLLLLGLFPSLFGDIPPAERAALISLYVSTKGDTWAHKDNWLGPAGTEGTWYGVTATDEHVVELNLSDNGLVGPLPAEIGDLSELRVLDLHGSYSRTPMPIIPPPRSNNLSGSLPGTIGKLTKLQILDASCNGLAGAIPPEIGLLSSLLELNLSLNDFTSLPAQLGNLSGLQKLNLLETNITSLTGLQGLTGLEELDISGLSLTLAQFPPELRSLSRLKKLAAHSFGISAVPEWIGSLANLESLDLSSNLISELPGAFGSLGRLRFLDLSMNHLAVLPVPIGSLQALEQLKLSWNWLVVLPDSIGNLRNLRELEIDENDLTSLPAGFAGLSALRLLNLSNNQLPEMPSVLGSLAKLEELYLYGCQMQGPIPASIGSLRQLRVLYLTYNQLTGIPAEIGNLDLLETLDLSRNYLQGEIPRSIGGLKNLKRLHLTDNLLSGPIPPEISGLVNLEVLELNLNDLTGPIPPMGNLKRLTHVNLYFNRLQGPIPEGLGSLPELQGLGLGANNLVGELPADFIQLKDVSLNLGFNGLYTNDPELESMLAAKLGEWWQETQVVAPKNVAVASFSGSSARLTWTPINFMNTGWPITAYYEVFSSAGTGAPFSLIDRTNGLDVASIFLEVPEGATEVHFKIRTVVQPHNHNQKNTVISDFSSEAAAALPTSTRFCLPFFETGTDLFMGIAVSNLASRATPLEFSAMGPTGESLNLERNPYQLLLGSGSQMAMLGDEIFRVAESSQQANGWVELTSDSPQIGSFFLAGRDGQLDGATALAGPSREFFFNRVTCCSNHVPGVETVIHLSIANPADEEITVTFSLEGWNQGPVISSAGNPTIKIPPRGVAYRTVQEIFGIQWLNFSSYIRCRVSGGTGAVGFALLQLPQALVAVPSQESTGNTRLYSAQLAAGPGLFTNLKLSNTSREKRHLVLKIADDSGAPIAEDRLVTIDPLISEESDIRDWFRSLWTITTPVVCSLEVIADGPGVIGDVVYGDPDNLRYASSLVLQGQAARTSVFGHLVSTADVFTGLALFNPNSQVALVELETYNQQGQKTGSANLDLGPRARISKLLPELVSAVSGQIGGYIRVKSDEPLVAQQMFGDSGLGFLSAVPAVSLSDGN